MKKQIAIVIILLLGIAVSVFLSQRQQIFKSRAALQAYSAFNVASSEPGKYVSCSGNVCETNTLNITISLSDLQALNIQDQQVASQQCSWQSAPLRCTGCGVASILEQDSCKQEIRVTADDIASEECNLPEWCGSYVTQNTTERPPEQIPEPSPEPSPEPQGEPQPVCEEKSYCDNNLGLRVFWNTCQGTPVKEAQFDLECVPAEQVALNLKLREEQEQTQTQDLAKQLEQEEQARIEAKKAETANIPQNVANFVGGLPGGVWEGIGSLWESQQQKPPEKNIVSVIRDYGILGWKIASSIFTDTQQKSQQVQNLPECQESREDYLSEECRALLTDKRSPNEKAAEAEAKALDSGSAKESLKKLNVDLDVKEEKLNIGLCLNPLVCLTTDFFVPQDSKDTVAAVILKRQTEELAEKLDLDLSINPNEWDSAKREYFFKMVANGDINVAKALAEFLVPVTSLENLQVSKRICEKKYQGNCIVSSDNILGIVNMSDQDIEQANQIAPQLYPQFTPAPREKVREYAKILYSDSTINDQYLSDTAKAKYDRQIAQNLGVSPEELLNIKNTFKVYGQVGDHIRNNTSEGKLFQQDQNTAALEGSIAAVTSIPAADLAVEGLVFGVRKVAPKVLSVLIRDYGDDAAKKIAKDVESVAERGGKSMTAAEAASIRKAEAALVESSGDDLALAATPAESLDNLVRGGGLDNDAAAAVRAIRDDPNLDQTAAQGLKDAHSASGKLGGAVVVIPDGNAGFVTPNVRTGNPFRVIAVSVDSLADNVDELLVRQGDEIIAQAGEPLQNPVLATIADEQTFSRVLKSTSKLSEEEVRKLVDDKIVITSIADQANETAQTGDLQQAWEYAYSQVSRQVRSLVTESEVDSSILSQMIDEKTAEALGMKVFYHYTSEKGAAGIASEGIIRASKSGLAGKGVYVSDVGPVVVQPISLIDHVVATYALTNPFGITHKIGTPKGQMTDYFAVYVPEGVFNPTWMNNIRYMRAWKAGGDLSLDDPRVVVKGPFKREPGEEAGRAGRGSLDNLAGAEAKLLVDAPPPPNPAREILADVGEKVDEVVQVLSGGSDQVAELIMARKALDNRQLTPELQEVWGSAVRDTTGRFEKYEGKVSKGLYQGVQPTPDLNDPSVVSYLQHTLDAREDFLAGLSGGRAGGTVDEFKAWIVELHQKQAYKPSQKPGELLQGITKSGGTGQTPIVLQDVVEIAEKYGDSFAIAIKDPPPGRNYKLILPEIDPTGWPQDIIRGDTVEHLYPPSISYDSYFGAMQAKLNKLQSIGLDAPIEAQLKTIAEFYQYAINARMFTEVNQSLYMNMVNGLLKERGLKPIEHGILDFVAMRLQPDNFARYFSDEVAGKQGVKSVDELEQLLIRGKSLAPCPIKFSLIPVAYAQGPNPCPKNPVVAIWHNAQNTGKQVLDKVGLRKSAGEQFVDQQIKQSVEISSNTIKQAYPEGQFSVFSSYGSSAVLYESKDAPGSLYKTYVNYPEGTFPDALKRKIEIERYAQKEARNLTVLSDEGLSPRLIEYTPTALTDEERRLLEDPSFGFWAKEYGLQKDIPLSSTGRTADVPIVVMEKIDVDPQGILKLVADPQRKQAEIDRITAILEKHQLYLGDAEAVMDKNGRLWLIDAARIGPYLPDEFPTASIRKGVEDFIDYEISIAQRKQAQGGLVQKARDTVSGWVDNFKGIFKRDGGKDALSEEDKNKGLLEKAAILLSALSLLVVPDNPAQHNLPTPTPVEKSQSGEIGKGEAQISLAYQERTNLQDPVIKTRVEEDIETVTAVVNRLPILGDPLVSLSAQERYGYDFPAVDRDSIGRFHKEIGQLFLNMEIDDPFEREHLILHELGGHYLSVRQNFDKLAQYMDPESAQKALLTENDLITRIKKYKENQNPEAVDIILDKFNNRQRITWEEIVEAANDYAYDVWQNPTKYLQFRDKPVDWKKVEERADDELYADFTAFLLQAQNLGLFDKNYQHPVLEILAKVKIR